MSARLFAIVGPLQGRTVTLAGDPVTLGRSSDADVQLSDRAVSRKHCTLEGGADGYRVIDLDSVHGTAVNGERIRERSLQHLDRLSIGGSQFVFVAEGRDWSPLTTAVDLADGERGDSDAYTLKLDDVLGVMTIGRPEFDEASRKARDLRILLRVTTAINSLKDPTVLQQRLLELSLEAVPARRSALVLVGADGQVTATLAHAATVSDGPVRLSRTIVERVLNERVSVMENDVSNSDALADAESVVELAIGSVLCVPLLVVDRLLGAMYLDAAESRAVFDSGHLELATAIAAVAAVALSNAWRTEWLEAENSKLRADLNLDHDMIGDSDAMQGVLGMVARVAPRDSTVLIRGESGTGKELVARAVHGNSPRRDKPFVAINCAAMPDNLLESELFGHEKGAFTGAGERKKGKIELADHGTLFLDEIGELKPGLQAKLLRVLQERELERVGGARPIKIDIRLVAATNRDLEQEVAAGNFRQDLFYRLNVIALNVPALRDRRADIPALAQHFADRFGASCGRGRLQISERAMAALSEYDWPGNVRELENAIERATVLGSGQALGRDDLPEALLERTATTATAAAAEAPSKFHDAVNAAKKDVIRRAFHAAGGSYTEAAKILDVHPNSLHRLIRNLQLKAEFEA